MFVVFTPGPLIRGHHSAAYTSAGSEIDRPEDEDRSYAAFASVPDAGGDAPDPPMDGSHTYVKLNLEFRANSGAVDDGQVTLTLPDHIRAWDEDEEELPQVTVIDIVTGGEGTVADGPESMADLVNGGVDIWVQFDPAELAAADLAEAVELTYKLAFADGAPPAAVTDELLLHLVAIFADTNRDGTVDLADLDGKDTFTNESGAVYVVNYHHYKNRRPGGTPVQDAIRWSSRLNLNQPERWNMREISPGFEQWIIDPATQPMDLFTPLHVLPMDGLEEDVEVWLSVPEDHPHDMRAFHMYIVDQTAEGVDAYIPVWGGYGTWDVGESQWASSHQDAVNTRGNEVNLEREVDLTKWLNPNSEDYQETRLVTEGPEARYEFLIEGIMFRDMPFPLGPDGYGIYYAQAEIFDGLLRIGLTLKSEGGQVLEPDWVELSYCGLVPADEEGDPIRARAFEDSEDEVLTAQGFGRYAQGGRYGHVYTVTTNRDDPSDPNSLRFALESAVPRTIIFSLDAGDCINHANGSRGTIRLNERLRVTNPFVTIAGQTAFRGGQKGIALADYGLEIETDDVIVRFIRSRPGSASGADLDAIEVKNGATRVIIDHCSTSYSTDELLSVSGGSQLHPTRRPNRFITVQNCIIAWPLDEAGHSSGNPHGYGSLIRANLGSGVSYWRNIYAHTRGRAPRPGNYSPVILGHSAPNVEDSIGLDFDFVNNVIYGWGEKHQMKFNQRFAGNDDSNKDDSIEDVPNMPEHAFVLGFRVRSNFIANYYRGRRSANWGEKTWFRVQNAAHRAHFCGNRINLSPQNGALTPGEDDPFGWTQYHENFLEIEGDASEFSFIQNHGEPEDPPFLRIRDGVDYGLPWVTMQGGAAEQSVRRRAGASLKRDHLDEFLLGEDGLGGQYQNRAGTIIDDPQDIASQGGVIGGYPQLNVFVMPQADSDGDGLPDVFEDELEERDPLWKHDRRNALLKPSPEKPGYTLLELYLMQLVNELTPNHWHQAAE